MPELPEVETIVRALAPRLTGRAFLGARYRPSRVFGGQAVPDLAGAQVGGVRRHGKFIVIETGAGTLALHLGMTGKLLLDGPDSPYVRAVWELEGVRLVYDDIRQFGRVLWAAEMPAALAGLGPDPLEIGLEDLCRRLAARRTPLKSLLLQQEFLRGLGNIYADEALHRAGLHPLRRADGLGRGEAQRLWNAIRELLTEAIACGGSSISDYVDTEGRRGSFQERHRVYARGGQPCPQCGAMVERIVVSQRGTHFCPTCQKAGKP